MHTDETLKNYQLKQNSFNRLTPIETKAITVKTDGTKPNITGIYNGPIFWYFLGLSTIWLAIFFMFPTLWRNARDTITNIKYLNRIKCRNCLYFTNSPYLKCTVHPNTALTKQAINCSDYRKMIGRSESNIKK